MILTKLVKVNHLRELIHSFNDQSFNDLREVGVGRGIEHVVNIEDVVIGSSHRVLSLAGSAKALSFKDYIWDRIS